MLLSSVALSFFTLFAKFGIENISYFLLTFLRFGIPFLLLLPYLLWTTSIGELFHTSNFKIQLARCGCILVYQYSMFYYLMHANLLDATVLQNTAPLFMPLLERLFFKHRFNTKVWISIIVSFMGVLCILQPDKEIFARLSIAGLLVPLGQAGSQVFFGHQARNENQKSNLFYIFFLPSIFTAIAFLFSVEFLGEGISLQNHSAIVWINVIALGVVSIFNQTLRSIAYRYGKPSALAPFLYFSLIFSAFFDWAIFHHLPNWLSMAGTIFVIAGGIIQFYKRK